MKYNLKVELADAVLCDGVHKLDNDDAELLKEELMLTELMAEEEQKFCCAVWHALARIIRKEAENGESDNDAATSKMICIYLICPMRINEVELRLHETGSVGCINIIFIYKKSSPMWRKKIESNI